MWKCVHFLSRILYTHTHYIYIILIKLWNYVLNEFNSVDFVFLNDMVMNGITLVVLFLKAIQVLCSLEELRSLENCGSTPDHTRNQIVGGNIIPPDLYSWIASLEYGNREFGYCGGSVISSEYVLTAAHCVNGEQVVLYGGL